MRTTIGLFFLFCVSLQAVEVRVTAEHQLNISKSHMKGPKDAKVQLVFFSSYDCGPCRKVKPILNEILKANPDEVLFVLKSSGVSPNSHIYQAIAYCAGLQGEEKYWQVSDTFYAGLDPYFAKGRDKKKELHSLFSSIGLDIPKIDACLDGSDTGKPEEERKAAWVEPIIETDYEEAARLEIRFLPALFVNGKLLQVELTRENIQRAIDEALK